MRRNKSTIIFIMFCLIGFSEPLCAQDNSDTDLFGEVIFEHKKIVVTASRVEEDYEKVGSTITIISQTDIQRRKPKNVLDLLRTVPGVRIVQNGGSGQTSSIFIRGTNREHTIIMLDGVPLNDPMDVSRSANISNIQVSNIDRIEILRGAHSTIYGADAIGGVINIITKKSNQKPQWMYQQKFGSQDTYEENLESWGKVGKISYSAGVLRYDTDGISAANKEDGNTEEDGSSNTTYSGRVEVEVTENLSVGAHARYSDLHFDFDSGGGPGGDNSNNEGTSHQLIAGVFVDHQITPSWSHRAEFSHMDLKRRFNNSGTFEGKIYRINWQHLLEQDLDLFFLNGHMTILGYDFKVEEGESTFSANNNSSLHGVYVQERLTLFDDLHVSIGSRVDIHDEFGAHFTWKTTGTYTIAATGTKVKGTIGTGFKAPSLFQLFDPDFGNLLLNPEKSFSVDVGVEQPFWDERVIIGTTFFHNNIDDIIIFTFPAGYINSSEATTYGFESFVKLTLTDKVDAEFTHTYLQTEDKATGLPLLRRPENIYNINVNIHPTEKLNINTNVLAVTQANDIEFNLMTFASSRVHLENYVKADVTVTYDINEFLQLFVQAENITNEKYEEVGGFGTLGRSYLGGFRLIY